MTRCFSSHSGRFSALAAFLPFLCAASVFAQISAPTRFPAPGAKDVCPDTPLKINFATAPALGTGKIEVCDAADDSVAATIDLAQPTRTQSIGGLDNFIIRSVELSGSQAILSLPPHALHYGKTYYIKIPPSAFSGVNLEGPDLTNKSWQFTTQSAPPAATAARFTVAADGTGDFATLQAAIDFLPEGNKTPRTILIKPGTYNEILCLMNRDNITLLGEDRKKTIIAAANNDRFNSNTNGNPFGLGVGLPGSIDPKTGPVYRRGLLLAHRVSGLTIANLTLRNTTPKGGSQAETIIFNGSPDAAHLLLTNLDLYSFQDTIQINGQAYINDCYMEGDVDFIWGTGPCYFQNVHARAVSNAAIFTTVRCPTTNHGFVFKDCTLDGAANVTGTFLARVEANRFPTSETILLNATLSSAISPAGWRAPTGGDASRVHFWEYNSHDADGKPIDTSRRIAASKQLKDPPDSPTIAQYSDPAFVLAGWKPGLPPLIAMSPAPATAALGTSVTLVVNAIAIPAPTYQWQKDGRDIPGATQPTLTLEKPTSLAAGNYTVQIKNALGTALTAPAQVQITNPGRN